MFGSTEIVPWMSYIRHESPPVISEAESVANVRDAIADALAKDTEARIKELIEVKRRAIIVLRIISSAAAVSIKAEPSRHYVQSVLE